MLANQSTTAIDLPMQTQYLSNWILKSTSFVKNDKTIGLTATGPADQENLCNSIKF